MRYDYENKLIIIEKEDSVREVISNEIFNFPEFMFVIERENGELDEYISVFDELRGYSVQNNPEYSFNNLPESEKLVVCGMCKTLDIFREFYRKLGNEAEDDVLQKYEKSVNVLTELEVNIWVAIDQFIVSRSN